jgi:TPP-dependent pyruvate/acetoin dehydrogenase alpha subunit
MIFRSSSASRSAMGANSPTFVEQDQPRTRCRSRSDRISHRRASEARFILRLRDPVERLARDAVLSEKEAQLGRMFLHVTHGVQLEL